MRVRHLNENVDVIVMGWGIALFDRINTGRVRSFDEKIARSVRNELLFTEVVADRLGDEGRRNWLLEQKMLDRNARFVDQCRYAWLKYPRKKIPANVPQVFERRNTGARWALKTI